MKKKIIFIILLSVSYFFKLMAQTNEIDSLKNLINKHQSKDTVKANLLNEIAYKFQKSDLQQTLKYAESAKKISGKLNYKKGEAESLRIIGLYYYSKSEYQKSLEYYNKSIKISKNINYKKGLAKCFNDIGNVKRKQGSYPQAIDFFQKALKIAEKINDKFIISKSLGNIGLIYWRREDYKQAQFYYQKSLKIAKEIGYKKGISNALNNIGILYYFLDNTEKAVEYLLKSLKIDEELGDISGVSYSYHNIGEIYKLEGDNEKALEYYEIALKIRKEQGDKFGICSSYMGIGTVYLKKKNYKKSLSFLDNGLKLAEELELIERQRDLHELLSSLYNETNNYKKAYNNYVQFKTLNDSIYNEENIKKITGLEYKYKFEKEKQAIELEQQKKDLIIKEESKRQKIVRNAFIIGFIFAVLLVVVVFRNFLLKRRANILLEQQKNEIKERNAQLRQLNFTQNRLMSIISHDFKAPLSAFYSITNSLKTKFDKIERKEIDRLLVRMLNSSVALKMQLENMLNWAITQQREISVSKSMYNLSVLVYKVVIILQEFANEKSITIENNIKEECEITTDGRLLSIVLTNLITNSVKFSKFNSKVYINAYKQNDKIIISVKDKGIGISEKDTQNLFAGNENSKSNQNTGTRLGLIVSKDIITKLGGKIWVKSKLEQGTEFYIEL